MDFSFFAYMAHFSRDKRGPYIRNWLYTEAKVDVTQEI